jgi:hypothetical protein
MLFEIIFAAVFDENYAPADEEESQEAEATDSDSDAKPAKKG